MDVESCIPIIPSADLLQSLLLWKDGLGFNVESEMEQDGKLVFCMLRKAGLRFMLNRRDGSLEKPGNYEGIRLYWAPKDIKKSRAHLVALGFNPSGIVEREYGRSEFFLTDSDGYEHCFGTESNAK